MEKINNDYTVLIKYHDENYPRIEWIEQGDWFDLYSAERVELEPNRAYLISLGISMKLPPNYELHILPRGSTFKTWKIIQTNHMGIVDESYCGTYDIIKYPCYSFGNEVINKYDKICQGKIVLKQPRWNFIEVDKLCDKNRGGFGSTGRVKKKVKVR